MNLDDMIKKSASDLDDIMSSIEAVKGEKFVKALALHINYTTLVTLAAVASAHEDSADIHKMISKTSVICASASLEYISELCGFKDADVKELIDWGERLQNQIQGNLNQVKGTE